MVAVCRSLGSGGKSTLLHVLGLALDALRRWIGPDWRPGILAAHAARCAHGRSGNRPCRVSSSSFHHLLPEFSAPREYRDADAHCAAGSRRLEREVAPRAGDARAGRLDRPARHTIPGCCRAASSQRVAIAPGARDGAVASCWPTSRRGTSTSTRPKTLHDLLREMHRETRPDVGHRDAQTLVWRRACNRVLRLEDGQLREAR